MGLLKYTTEVPVEKRVAEICELLVDAGALGIMQRRDANRKVVAIEFEMSTPKGPMWFRLPAAMANVRSVLLRQAREGKIEKKGRYTNEEKAERVAWGILAQRVQTLVTVIEVQMEKPEQAFLAYAVDRDSGKTVYELMESQKFGRLALPPPTAKKDEVLEGEVMG